MDRNDKLFGIFAAFLIAGALLVGAVSYYSAKTRLNVHTISYSEFRDNLDHAFEHNTFALDSEPLLDPSSDEAPVQREQPGISFLGRMDQRELFKLHLPYVLRTPEMVDSRTFARSSRAASMTSGVT